MPKNKVVPIEEAMSHIKSGMSIAVGGFIGQGDPLTLIDYLKTMDVGDLTIYENDAGYRERGVVELVKQGKIKKVVASHIGTTPEIGKAMNEGRLEVEPTPQGTLAEMMRGGGGGGIPVVRNRPGASAGVAAVIDKDLAAALLARDVGADVLVILTDVPNAYLHYGTADQVALEAVPYGVMATYQQEGHFKAGSMGPKVDAAMRFVASGGEAIIANLLQLEQALADESVGTHILAEQSSSRSKRAAV